MKRGAGNGGGSYKCCCWLNISTWHCMNDWFAIETFHCLMTGSKFPIPGYWELNSWLGLSQPNEARARAKPTNPCSIQSIPKSKKNIPSDLWAYPFRFQSLMGNPMSCQNLKALRLRIITVPNHEKYSKWANTQNGKKTGRETKVWIR